MRVGIHARILSSPHYRGWSRYTFNLITELKKLNITVVLFSDREIHSRFTEQFCDIEIVYGQSKSYLIWEQIELPRLLKKHRIDVFHNPINFGIPILSPCPTILTLHDAIDFTYYAAHKKRDLRSILSTFMHWYSRKSADTIITVSHHAKKDLIQYLSIPENKIRVTYEGAEDHFKKIERNTELFLDFEKRFGLNKPFFFYLGGFDKRKNVPFLIDTILKMNRDDFQLVLAGGKKEELPDTLCEKLNHQILFADWLEDSEVIALYNEAQAFIYPSFYEGFGLQVCEAMSCHCPVITSNRSSLPEVIDNPDALFSPDDSTKLQTLITNILDDKDFRKKLKDHSIERIKSFSWKKLAKQSLDIYQQVLK